MRILVFGGGSLLARAFTGTATPGGSVRIARHDDIDAPDLMDGIDVVVNFARHPDDMRLAHDPERDVDLRLARRVAGTQARYVMLSSRKVYAADAQQNATEDAPLSGLDVYGRNKVAAEAAKEDGKQQKKGGARRRMSISSGKKAEKAAAAQPLTGDDVGGDDAGEEGEEGEEEIQVLDAVEVLVASSDDGRDAEALTLEAEEVTLVVEKKRARESTRLGQEESRARL